MWRSLGTVSICTLTVNMTPLLCELLGNFTRTTQKQIVVRNKFQTDTQNFINGVKCYGQILFRHMIRLIFVTYLLYISLKYACHFFLGLSMCEGAGSLASNRGYSFPGREEKKAKEGAKVWKAYINPGTISIIAFVLQTNQVY